MIVGSDYTEAQDVIAAEERSSSIFHRSLFLAYFLLIFIVLVIISLVVISSRRFTDYSSCKRISQIESLIMLETIKMDNLTLEYGWWNEAIENIVYKNDIEWTNDNLGYFLLDNYDISTVLAYDKEDSFKYGLGQNGNLENFSLEPYGTGISKLIEGTLESDIAEPDAVSGFFLMEDKLQLVSVCVFAAYEPTELDITQSHGYLILIRNVSEEMLESFSTSSGIENIKIVQTDQIADGQYVSNEFSLVYDPTREEIAALTWPEEDDVQSFLHFFLLLSCILISCIIMISLVFYRNLFNYNRLTNRIISREKAINDKLSLQANYDELTGLPNRHLFIDRLNQMIKRCNRSHITSSMLFLDLNGFKNINDTLGHESGDQLLIQVGTRLKEIIRQQDTVSRFGGDEFCILLEGVGTVENNDCVLIKIQSVFEKPFILNEENHFISASIGVVLIPDDSCDETSLLRFADIAMYQAKRQASKKYSYYTAELDLKAHERSLIRNGLMEALDKGEMCVHYQPIYDLKTQKLEYVEALMRWNSSESGFVSPEVFIPVAEESDMINKIGFWIIKQSIGDVMEINGKTCCSIRVSINVSVKQLSEPDFLEKFLEIVDNSGMDRSLIQLEITESILIDDNIFKKNVLQNISDSGFKIVMDDFGTGYSSLSYISRIPLKTIKIDKAFVSKLDQNEKEGAMIRTIIFMADAYGLDTVAEGIETKEQEDFLLSSGCRFGQGYLYSRPVGKEAIIMGIFNKSFPVEVNGNDNIAFAQ